MARPEHPLHHNPVLYERLAFECLCWLGLSFEAAMQDPARRDIIKFIASHWPRKPMENVIPISRVCQLATGAARTHATAREANPYPEYSAAGGLYAQCFDLEKARIAQAAAEREALTPVPAGETD